jgi:hypothetical protein
MNLVRRREHTVLFMHEQLVNERIQRLHDEVARSRQAQEARRAKRARHISWARRLFSQPAAVAVPDAVTAAAPPPVAAVTPTPSLPA